MANQDWDKFGDDISRTVQEAIDSQNFNRLNQTITNTINSAMNTVGKSLHDAGDAVGKTAKGFQHQNYDKRRTYQNSYRYRRSGDRSPYSDSNIYREDNEQQYQRGQQYQQDYQYQQNRQGNLRTEDVTAVREHPELFVRTTGTKAGGVLMTIVGYALGISMFLIFAFSMIGAALAPHLASVGIMFFAILAGVLFLGGTCLAGIGTLLLGKVKRYRVYLTKLGDRDYCEVKELAQELKKPVKYVIKDIGKMIKRGWFKQGHLDGQKTCLIVSNDAFAQYNALMDHMEKQKQEEKQSREKQEKEQKSIDPRVQEVIQAGDAYIKKIRECNDAIPGEEISAKISRMEVLINRIFERVEQNPESVADIRRLMEYYLPTTVKLLEAYQELEAAPVQGENIISSKKEIESTLDTLNVAFEKLLDSLFQDTAWNVAADISVLNTMLAQEGLTKDDF